MNESVSDESSMETVISYAARVRSHLAYPTATPRRHFCKRHSVQQLKKAYPTIVYTMTIASANHIIFIFFRITFSDYSYDYFIIFFDLRRQSSRKVNIVKIESAECFMTFRDVVLLPSEVDILQQNTYEMVTESYTLAWTKFIRLYTFQSMLFNDKKTFSDRITKISNA